MATKNKNIISNRIRTPDGTILTSRHVHDYVTYTDKNGEEYMVDGGHQYLRRNINKEPAEELSIYDDAPFEIIRESFEWGTYGKDGKNALKFVKLSEMSDAHISALFQASYLPQRVRNLLCNEVEYRRKNNIKIND